MAKGSSNTNLQKATSELTNSSSGVKYMQEVEAWFDELIKRGEQENDAQYRKRLLNGIKTRLV
jgi:hypothetical protein